MTRRKYRCIAHVGLLSALACSAAAQTTYPSTLTVQATYSNGIATVTFNPSYSGCLDSDDFVIDTATIGTLTTSTPILGGNNVLTPSIEEPIGPGSYAVSGTWGGFSGYPTNDPLGNCTVSPSSATTTLIVPAPELSTTQASGPASPVRAGQTAVVTVVVTGSDDYVEGPNPTGNVVLFYQGTVLASSELHPLNTAVGYPISSVATFDFPTSGVVPGAYALEAVYNGDSNLTSSSAQAASVMITAAQVPTSTALTASPATLIAGQNVTFTATVTPSVSGTTPTGTVTLSVGTLAFGTAKLNSSGIGILTLATAGLPVGAYAVIAKYGGDQYNAASTSAAQTVTVQAATSTSVVATPATLKSGATTTFSATVVRIGSTGEPTGTVNFLFDGYTLGSAIVNSQGVATLPFSTANLAAGSYSITASYAGDALDAASTSTPVALSVQ
jgi:hypothetical protein